MPLWDTTKHQQESSVAAAEFLLFFLNPVAQISYIIPPFYAHPDFEGVKLSKKKKHPESLNYFLPICCSVGLC